MVNWSGTRTVSKDFAKHIVFLHVQLNDYIPFNNSYRNLPKHYLRSSAEEALTLSEHLSEGNHKYSLLYGMVNISVIKSAIQCSRSKSLGVGPFSSISKTAMFPSQYPHRTKWRHLNELQGILHLSSSAINCFISCSEIM